MIQLSSATALAAEDRDSLKAAVNGLKQRLPGLSATAARHVRVAVTMTEDVLKNPRPAKSDLVRAAKAMQRVATDEDVYPKEVRDRRVQEQLDTFSTTREPAGQRREPSAMPVQETGSQVEIMPFFRDEPQNAAGLTRSPSDPSRIAENIMILLSRRQYQSAQEAFDGHLQDGGPYYVASFDQKKRLAGILRSYGFLINFDEKAVWALDNSRRKNNKTVGYEKAEPQGNLPLALGQTSYLNKLVYRDGQPVEVGDLAQGGPTFGTARVVEINDDGSITGENVQTGELLSIFAGDADLIERGSGQDIRERLPQYMEPSARRATKIDRLAPDPEANDVAVACDKPKKKKKAQSLNKISNNFVEVGYPGGGTVWFSYKTPVAFQKDGPIVVRQNDWGPTTGKHLKYIDDGRKENRVSGTEFEKMLQVAFGGEDVDVKKDMPLFGEKCKKHKKQKDYGSITLPGDSISIPGGPPGSAPSAGGGATAVRLSSATKAQRDVGDLEKMWEGTDAPKEPGKGNLGRHNLEENFWRAISQDSGVNGYIEAIELFLKSVDDATLARITSGLGS